MKRWTLIAALAILAVIALAPATANAHDGPVVVAALDFAVIDSPTLAVVAHLEALPADNYKNVMLLGESTHNAPDFNYVSTAGAGRGQRPTGFKESEHRARDVPGDRGRE